MRGTLDHSNSFKDTEIGPIPVEWEAEDRRTSKLCYSYLCE